MDLTEYQQKRIVHQVVDNTLVIDVAAAHTAQSVVHGIVELSEGFAVLLPAPLHDLTDVLLFLRHQYQPRLGHQDLTVTYYI